MSDETETSRMIGDCVLRELAEKGTDERIRLEAATMLYHGSQIDYFPDPEPHRRLVDRIRDAIGSLIA